VLVEGLDHAVLSLDVILDLFEIVRHFAEVLLLLPVDWLLHALGTRQDVLNCVSCNEVFIGLQSLHWLLAHARHRRLLVAAVVGEVPHWVARKVPGGRVSFPIVPVCRFRKASGSGLRSPLT
jgi:hypothetical protein